MRFLPWRSDPPPIKRPRVREWGDWLAAGLEEAVIERGEEANLPLYRAALTAGAVAFEVALTDPFSPLRRSKAARAGSHELLPRFAWGAAIRLFQDGFNEELELYAWIEPEDRDGWFGGFEEVFALGRPLMTEARCLWETYHALPDRQADVEFEHTLAAWLAAPVLQLPGYVRVVDASKLKGEPWRLQQTMLAATTNDGVEAVGEMLHRRGVSPPQDHG